MKRILPFLWAAAAWCAPAGSQRDWTQYPAIVQIRNAPEIFALGDVHSDFKRLGRALAAAGIIEQAVENPENAKWCAGHAVLVTTGDMIDKGPRALDVIRLLKRVREDAREAGGDVVILAGNHEAEFLADPDAPQSREFAGQLKAAHIRPADVAACRGEFGEFLCSLGFAAKIDDWFFSHAGNSGGRKIEDLAIDLETSVAHDGFATKQLIGTDSILESRLNGNGRIPWIDTGLPDVREKDLLSAYAEALGVTHIVQGHVPSEVRFEDGVIRNEGEMFQRFGLLFLIDTGMSEGVDSSGGAILRITFADGEQATAICADGRKTVVWDSGTRQDPGRAAPCPR
jgi:hypothetical protein